MGTAGELPADLFGTGTDIVDEGVAQVSQFQTIEYHESIPPLYRLPPKTFTPYRVCFCYSTFLIIFFVFRFLMSISRVIANFMLDLYCFLVILDGLQ